MRPNIKRKRDYFSKTILLSGVAGSGKTYAIRDIIKENKNSKKTYIIQHINDFEALCQDNRGNLITLRNIIEVNVFNFHPGKYSRGEYYSYLFKCHCMEVFTFIKILMNREINKTENKLLLKGIYDMYEGLGITKEEYRPNYKNILNHLNFHLFVKLMKEVDPELSSELDGYSHLFAGDKNISTYFENKNKDVSFNNKINVIDTSGLYSLKEPNSAVLYSYLIAIKRRIRLDVEPSLIIVDEGFLFFNDVNLIKTLLLNNGKAAKQAELLVSIQSLTDVAKNLRNVLKLANRVILFRQSEKDASIIKKCFNLPNAIIKRISALSIGEAILIEDHKIRKVKYK